MTTKLDILEPLWVNLHEKKLTEKKILDPSPRENRRKTSKMAKNGIFEALGELTCELQVKITLFYHEMVNSVMALQIWSPKIIFWYDFRPISVKNW